MIRDNNTNFSNRIIYNSNYGFTIKTNNVSYVVDPETGYESYNFSILRDSPLTNNLENLLLRTNSIGELDAYIVEYGFTKEMYSSLTSENIVNYNVKYTPINFDASLIQSKMVVVITCEPSGEWVTGTEHSGQLHGVNSGGCNISGCSYGSSTFVLTGGTTCTTSSYDDGSGYFIPGQGSSSPGGGGSYGNGSTNSNPNNSNNDLPEVPTLPEELCVFTLPSVFDNLELSDAQKCWLNSENQFEFKTLTTAFLSSGGSEDFVMLAIPAVQEGGEVDYPNQVILDSTFTNNITLKCVYEKLAQDASQLFRDTVETFNQDADFNLTFKVGNCENTDDACAVTSQLSNTGNITIIIEDANTNPIQLAQMILHEAIHAELAKYVYQYQQGIDINNRAYLFQLYKYYKALYDEGDIDHIYMSIKYVNPIANALRQYDNNNYPLDYYKSFAWDGLRKWDASNILGDDEEDTYQSYRSIVIQNSNVCN